MGKQKWIDVNYGSCLDFFGHLNLSPALMRGLKDCILN